LERLHDKNVHAKEAIIAIALSNLAMIMRLYQHVPILAERLADDLDNLSWLRGRSAGDAIPGA
jgi:hypothetical protein